MADFCPGCGKKIAGGGKFCFFCGFELPPPAEEAPSEGETAQVPAAAIPAGETGSTASDDTARLPVEPSPPSPPGPPARSYPWRWIVLVAAAGIILSASAGSALAFITEDESTAGKSTSKSSKAGADDDKPAKTRTSKTTGTDKTTDTGTTRTTSNGDARAYIAAMDDLVSQNYQLEQRIGVLADEINRVAPGGIDEGLLYEIDQLGVRFLAINSDAQGLDVPSAFDQSHRYFLQLTTYNMDRCDALYAGATFWRAGQSYQPSFEDGRIARDAYWDLYPVFEDEYGAAKTSPQ